jgi:hypothetical protein
MAVKVMIAPAIASLHKDAPRPRRRKSAVFDGEGNEVFITLMCLKCHKMKPLSQFGLRKMADGAIRNQPWCRPCRSGAGVEKPSNGRKEGAVSEGSVDPVVPAAAAAPTPQATPSPAAPANENLAAQIAAALYGGRR